MQKLRLAFFLSLIIVAVEVGGACSPIHWRSFLTQDMHSPIFLPWAWPGSQRHRRNGLPMPAKPLAIIVWAPSLPLSMPSRSSSSQYGYSMKRCSALLTPNRSSRVVLQRKS